MIFIFFPSLFLISGTLFVRLQLRFLEDDDWISTSRKTVSVQCCSSVKCEDCAT